MSVVIATRKPYPKRLPPIKLIYSNGSIIQVIGVVPQMLKKLPYKIADGCVCIVEENKFESISGDLFCCHLVSLPNKAAINALNDFYLQLISEMDNI